MRFQKTVFILLFLFLPLGIVAQEQNREASRRFAVLEQLYMENDRNQYTRFLITDFNAFLLRYPGSENDAEILSMLANLYEHTGQPYRAVLTHFKTIFLHPISAQADSARSRIEDLIQQARYPQLLEKAEPLRNKLHTQIPFENRAVNHFELLSFLYQLQIPPLNGILLEEFNRYEQLYGDTGEKEDILLLWKGRLFEALEEYGSAVGCYRLLLHLFPQSSLKAEALLRTGIVEYSRMGQDEKAMHNFIEIINSFPGTDVAGEAQFHLGRLYQLNRHNAEEALNNYQLLVETFPEHPRRAEALRYCAQILEKEKRYPEAVKYYNLFFSHFADDSLADTILLKMADLYEQQLNNPPQAAATLLTFARRFPQDAYAPAALYRAALLYKQAKQTEKVRTTCTLLINEYPRSPEAEKAKKLLDEL